MQTKQYYTGAGDPNLDLGEQRSLAKEDKIKRDFTISIENNSGEDKIIALLPGYLRTEKLDKTYQTVTLEDGTATGDVIKDANIDYTDPSMLVAAGFGVDLVADDGVIFSNGTGDLEVSSPDGRISALQDFVRQSPTRVLGMKMSVNDKDVFPNDFKIASLYPGQNVSVQKLPVKKYVKSSNMQDTLVETEDVFQLDANTVLFFKMPGTQNATPNTTIELTFNFGATHSIAEGLKEKAALAEDNFDLYGVEGEE